MLWNIQTEIVILAFDAGLNRGYYLTLQEVFKDGRSSEKKSFDAFQAYNYVYLLLIFLKITWIELLEKVTIKQLALQ